MHNHFLTRMKFEVDRRFILYLFLFVANPVSNHITDLLVHNINMTNTLTFNFHNLIKWSRVLRIILIYFL